MKFPNFYINKSFTARALVLLAGLFLMSVTVSAQRTSKGALVPEAVGLNIEQCANGPISMPNHCDTAGANAGYVRGNLVSSKSHYFEGDYVPIRIVIENLPAGTYTITVGYDYTKGGKYATDYLGNYNATESVLNDPCVGVTGCTLGSAVTGTFQIDPQVTAGFDETASTPDDITYSPGSVTCFGCSSISAGLPTFASPTSGDSSKFVTFTFTTTTAGNVVIAYGSHISTREDWGLANSAINISGSPYHNFISATTIPDTNQGNRDLQLSAEAVIFPASVKIVKLVANTDGTYYNTVDTFGFTATNFDVASFGLMDTDPAQTAGGFHTDANVTLFGSANTITVTENDPTGLNYTLLDLTCTVNIGGGGTLGTATGSTTTRTATIVPQEGNIITCTFLNSQLTPTAAPASVSGQVTRPDGTAIGGVSVTLTNATTGEIRQSITNPFGYYVFEDLEVDNFYVIQVSAKRVRFNNDTITFTLTEDLTDVNFVSNQ